MVSYYFSSLLLETHGVIVNELISRNKELQQFYDDLMNIEGLMSVNTCAKELGIGEYTLFSYLRSKKVFFYDKDKVNLQLKKPLVTMERSTTYVTKKGLDYIRKLLPKDGYYNVEVA